MAAASSPDSLQVEMRGASPPTTVGLVPERCPRQAPCSPTRSLVSAGRAPAWLRPPGKPGAERLRGPETPGQLPALPFTKGCPPRGMAPRRWLQRGLGGRSPASGAGALGPGEAAHLAVAGARLVHKGAVFTGPHGSRGSMRGTPNGPVLVEARQLHPNSACRVGREAVRSLLHREDVPPI